MDLSYIKENIMKHKKTNQGFLTQFISEVSSHGQLEFSATTIPETVRFSRYIFKIIQRKVRVSL